MEEEDTNELPSLWNGTWDCLIVFLILHVGYMIGTNAIPEMVSIESTSHYIGKYMPFIFRELPKYCTLTDWLDIDYVRKQLDSVNYSRCSLCNTLTRQNDSDSTKRNLILGFAMGHKQYNLITMARTLRTVSSKATFIIFVDNTMFSSTLSYSELEELKKYGVILFNIGSTIKYRDIPEITSRFVLFSAFLHKFSSDFDRVIMADLYDTYFQQDPFCKAFSLTTGFHATAENVQILSSPPNRQWISQHDPNFSYEKYRGRKVINGGLQYGDIKSTLTFLESYIDYNFWFNYSRGKMEQAMMNIMYVEGRLPKCFIPDYDASIMISATHWYFDREPNKFGMFKTNGVYPVTIHQYNRITPIRNYLPKLCPPLGNWQKNPFGHHTFTTQY